MSHGLNKLLFGYTKYLSEYTSSYNSVFSTKYAGNGLGLFYTSKNEQ